MSNHNRHYVNPHPDGWAVEREGADRASVVTDTKAEAVRRGAEIADRAGGSLVIRRSDGTFESERTYHRDPFPPRG